MKPTPGAMRAAERIFQAYITGRMTHLTVTAISTNKKLVINHIAQIIDDETGLRELLAAAKGLVGFIRGRHLREIPELIAIEAAIARAKGKTP